MPLAQTTRKALRRSTLAAALATLALSLTAAHCRTPRETQPPSLPPLPAPEFVALVQRLSEPGGVFPAENLVSNETSYLEVAELLEARVPKGGIYLGVGPDQNYNYVARLEPSFAYILDVRRQNLFQHLMFAALFEDAEDPFQFLCRLFSRPCPAETPAAARLGMEALLAALEELEPRPEQLALNQVRVEQFVEKELGFPAGTDGRRELRLLLQAFFQGQLEIRFRSSFRPSWLRLPTYRELLLVRSPSGRFGHYLASQRDYDTVRERVRARRVIPVVGDFAGDHALRAIGAHLRARGEAVSAFYLSNVEFYLFRGGLVPRFIENLEALPVAPDERSVLIRACFGFGRPHPELQPGRISVTLLQPIARFIEQGKGGVYAGDWDACTLDYVK